MSDKYAGNPNKSLEFLFYGIDPEHPNIFEGMCENGYPGIEVIFLLRSNSFLRKEKNSTFQNMSQSLTVFILQIIHE